MTILVLQSIGLGVLAHVMIGLYLLNKDFSVWKQK